MSEVKIKFTGDAKDAVQAAEDVASKLAKLVEEERNLKAALQDTNLTAQMSAEQQQALRRAHADAEEAVKKAGGAQFSFRDSLATLQPVVAAVTAAVGALAAAYAVAERNAAGMAQEEAFANLGGNADELTAALGGFVDTGDAVAVAQMAKGLGLTADQMTRLAAASRDVARVTGTTTREAFEALTKSVGMGTTEQLKGIMAKDAMIKAEQSLARQLDVSVDKLTTREKIDARMAAAERAMAAVRGAASGQASAAADQYERQSAALKELVGVVEDTATTSMADMATKLGDVAIALRDAVVMVEKLADAWNNSAWGSALSKVDALVDRVRGWVDLLLNPFSQLVAFVKVNADQFEGMFGKRPGQFASDVVDDFIANNPAAESLTTNAMTSTTTVLQPRRETNAEAKARTDGEAQRKAAAEARKQALADNEDFIKRFGASAFGAASGSTSFAAASAFMLAMVDTNRRLDPAPVERTADAYDEYVDSVSGFDWGAMAEESMAAADANERFAASIKEWKDGLEATQIERASTAMQDVGGAILGGSFDIGTLGNAIGMAAGGPMGGQIADAVMGALSGIVETMITTITALVGDERFASAFSETMSSAGGAITAALVGTIAALPAILVGVILGPWVALLAAATAIVWVPLLALNLAVLAVVGAFAGMLAVLVAMPALAVGLPIFAANLSTSTQSFARFQAAMSVVVDKMVAALEPFWEGMLWVVGVFDVVASIVEPFLASFAGSDAMASLLFDAVKLMVVAFGTAALGAGYLTNLLIGFAMVIGPMIGLSEEQTAAIGASTVNIRRLREAVDEAASMSFESATRAGEAAAAETDEPPEPPPDPGDLGAGGGDTGLQLTNVPSGFKALNAIYEAADAEDRSGDGGNGLEFNRDPGFVVNIENWNSRGDAARDFDELKKLARFGHKGPRGTSRRFGDNKN
jgi:hypothetical protein